jgi:hypothetical protein
MGAGISFIENTLSLRRDVSDSWLYGKAEGERIERIWRSEESAGPAIVELVYSR